MRLRFDEDFVEAAVLLCTTGRRNGIAPLQIARFNRQREKLYAILDPEDRNSAFFKLHLEWFREWGFERTLTEPLDEFPLVPAALENLAFRKSRSRSDDGSELYVNEAGERTGIVAMPPTRLVRDAELLPFLWHELSHLKDMVDPNFGYRPELADLGPALGSQRLAQERYRLLWDVSIDGRLASKGHQLMSDRAQRWLEFVAAFPFWTTAMQQETFELLWNDPNPTHQKLEEMVRDPRQLRSSAGPRPGAACPLCGFPTFGWAEQADLEAGIITAIRAEFPHWTPQQGICARCRAVYRQKTVPLVPSGCTATSNLAS